MVTPPDNPAPECPICRVVIPQLEARILELETKLRDLEDQLKLPTPKRPVDPQPPAPAKKTTGNKRGAQPGHKPHLKKWLPRERVKEVIVHIPKRCTKCDTALSHLAGTDDPTPTIHQVAELPKILAEITEHHGCYRTCTCGHVNHAPVPADVRAHSVGPNLTATIVYFAGSHGMSKRGIEETVETLFGVPIALGTIANLEQEASAALDPAYQEARRHVAQAEVKHVDETGWKEAGKKRWLWAAATVKVVLFLIHPRRNIDALKLLLGKLAGILVSDRWCVYDNWDIECRQLCWAHVKRNWDKQIERGGQAKKLGERWQATQKEVFELWHLFRGGGCTRRTLQRRLKPHIETLGDLLLSGVDSRDAVLSRHCQRLRARYPLLWLFSTMEGVEPTNNHAERVQRRAVLWRRKSFGCQSPSGCRFVERILTVVQSLRLQDRNTLEFLGQSIAAHRQGISTPTLCPIG
jgi:transposase